MHSIQSKLLWVTAALLMLPVGVGAGEDFKFSGFLEDYSGFKKTARSEGALVRWKAGIGLADLKQYDKIMLDPIQVFYAKDAQYKGISPDELKLVTDYFRSAITNALEPDYPVVDKTGAGVLRLRMAITGVTKKKPERSAIGYLPIALVFGAAKSAADASAGKEVIVVEASLEAEIMDSVTGDQLVATVDKRSGKEARVKKGEQSWQHVTGALDFWANKLRQRLDEAHGKTPAVESGSEFESEW